MIPNISLTCGVNLGKRMTDDNILKAVEATDHRIHLVVTVRTKREKLLSSLSFIQRCTDDSTIHLLHGVTTQKTSTLTYPDLTLSKVT